MLLLKKERNNFSDYVNKIFIFCFLGPTRRFEDPDDEKENIVSLIENIQPTH